MVGLPATYLYLWHDARRIGDVESFNTGTHDLVGSSDNSVTKENV